MADRGVLHKNSLIPFSGWLLKDGWELEKCKGSFEVLRARKGKRLLILYYRYRGDHLTVTERYTGVVRAFLRDKSQNAEQINYADTFRKLMGGNKDEQELFIRTTPPDHGSRREDGMVQFRSYDS